jgi:hypothetical protein
MYLNNNNTVIGMQKQFLIGFFLLLCVLCGFGSALTVYQNESQLIRSSDLIVYGKIVDVKSAWNAGKTHIETTGQVLVNDTLKNSDPPLIRPGGTIYITVLGGTVDNITEQVEDTPVLMVDTEAVFFLNKIRNNTYSVMNLYEVINGKIGGSSSPSAINDVAAFKQRLTAIQKNDTAIPTTKKAGLLYAPVVAIIGFVILVHRGRK